MNPFEFFSRKVCLTLGPDWPIACEEFERVGLDGVWRFDALPDIGPHQSFNRSTRQILSDFLLSGSETLLFLEDDVVFRDISHLEKALSELPEDWDIVYLGANIRSEAQRVSEHLFRVTNAWTTHCVGFNRKVVPFILENQPPFSEQMVDNWLGSQLGSLNAYVVAPMVAWQRPHWSIIWGRETNYDDVFQESEEKLK